MQISTGSSAISYIVTGDPALITSPRYGLLYATSTNSSFDFVYNNSFYLFESYTPPVYREFFEYYNPQNTTSTVSPFLVNPSGGTTIYWFDVISLDSSSVQNISYPYGCYFAGNSIIVNNTLFWVGKYINNENGVSTYSLYAVNIQKNALINIFSYPILGGSSFSLGHQGNTILVSSGSTDDVYDFEMYPTFPVTLK
ncbi:MAG: hypothetical protein ACP5L4_07100, partial [Thermoplasmata archaeon]